MLVASTLASKEHMQQAIFIRRTINLASRYTPWNSNCLVQALVAKFWCQRHAVPYLFFIGVAKKTNPPTQHKAHAWVTVGPIPLTGGGQQCLETHHVICSYSNAV
jgi:hypothetical protein